MRQLHCTEFLREPVGTESVDGVDLVHLACGHTRPVRYPGTRSPNFRGARKAGGDFRKRVFCRQCFDEASS